MMQLTSWTPLLVQRKQSVYLFTVAIWRNFSSVRKIPPGGWLIVLPETTVAKSAMYNKCVRKAVTINSTISAHWDPT